MIPLSPKIKSSQNHFGQQVFRELARIGPPAQCKSLSKEKTQTKIAAVPLPFLPDDAIRILQPAPSKEHQSGRANLFCSGSHVAEEHLPEGFHLALQSSLDVLVVESLLNDIPDQLGLSCHANGLVLGTRD